MKIITHTLCVLLMVSALINGAFAQDDIKLLKTTTGYAKDIHDALAARHSVRQFSNVDLSTEQLSLLLWAANGINRDSGKRTAPSAFGRYFIDIYALSAEGAYLYNPVKQTLHFVSEVNLKDTVGTQGFVQYAPWVLLLVAHLDNFPPEVSPSRRLNLAHATAGAIGENVYLMANSCGLATCFIGGINVEKLVSSLSLDANDVPLYIMPIGYEQH